MPHSSHMRSWPATGFMLAVVGAFIATALWMAFQRTARVEDEMTAQLPDMRIDINSASVAELSLLPGLGDRLAQRIVDDRETNGPFAAVEELQRVPGIGATTVERLRMFAICPPVDPMTRSSGGS